MTAFKPTPQIHPDSDQFYWTQIFPKSYKHRTITKLDWEDNSNLVADGDIRFELVDGKYKPFCNCCNNRIHKSKARLFGSFDVGLELVYYCDACNEGKFRLYDSN